MSGRSAYVRKVKTNVKENHGVLGATGAQYPQKAGLNISYHDFPIPVGHAAPYANKSSARSVQSEASDDMAYARVKRPILPNLEISGIEKSTTREKMDKMSESARKALGGFSFGKKKKRKDADAMEPEEEDDRAREQDSLRPPTSATLRLSNELYPQQEGHLDLAGSGGAQRQQPYTIQEVNEEPQPPPLRTSPPQVQLPALPTTPQIRRWLGQGRKPQKWNKLRKDPELWDHHGDTLIYLGHETNQTAHRTPSFRLSSSVLEQTGSRYFIDCLRDGYIDGSDISSSPERIARTNARSVVARHGGLPTPPDSDNGTSTQNIDGEISYELHFPAPMGLPRVDILRYNITTRNVFAMLYQASIVGLSFHQSLNDLYERLESYMSPQSDNAGLIIDYLIAKGLDDVRDDATAAVSLLVWSESKHVRWQEGWREAFVHCAGMHDRLDAASELRLLSPISRALLERASLESQLRLQDAEARLADFSYTDMWPLMSASVPPERSSFERLSNFFKDFYSQAMATWPPRSSDQEWLSRDLVKQLQEDFGALYEYIVDRDVQWDCSEERSSRKWNIARSDDTAFDVDTDELPITDILVAFDNRHGYPHIPHPYPLVPASILPKSVTSKSNTSSSEDKMIERKISLAYTEATNIYILNDFQPNKLVDAFVRFEKSDHIGLVDPFAARRGRWVLIYGILQTLASVSVDVPGLRWTESVGYHLNARLRGAVPWKGADPNIVEASHQDSYCWLAPQRWTQDLAEMPALEPPTRTRFQDRSLVLGSASLRSSMATLSTQSDAGSSIRSPGLPPPARSARRFKGQAREVESPRMEHFMGAGKLGYNDYGPGIERVEEWPAREESRASRRRGEENVVLQIKDFDDEYEF